MGAGVVHPEAPTGSPGVRRGDAVGVVGWLATSRCGVGALARGTVDWWRISAIAPATIAPRTTRASTIASVRLRRRAGGRREAVSSPYAGRLAGAGRGGEATRHRSGEPGSTWSAVGTPGGLPGAGSGSPDPASPGSGSPRVRKSVKGPLR